MQVAFVVFDGLTALDFVGFYDALLRLKTLGAMPELTWDLCALRPEVHDDRGLRLTPSRVGEPLADYDMVFVPGGFGTRGLRHDGEFVDWVRTAERVPLKVSVCTGALLLGAADFLRGRAATTHWSAFDLLAEYCGEVVRDRRIVDVGEVITARGVSTSIDLGLYVCERLAGSDVKQRIRRQMDYPYEAAYPYYGVD